MSSSNKSRRHAPQFKIQLCQDIRSGAIARHNAARQHTLPSNLIQLWLSQYDRGELDNEAAEASVVLQCEAQIAALERKVGQLTMELDLAKKAPRLRLVGGRENSPAIAGSQPAEGDGGVA
ncbi:transposase [Variovorax saccharolyticus]|uniref:transposase n=1 Tax=Variovorax saccharolyticus TaxID=3053516 RepID=UPI0025789548|nr:transposase [Variovorax sp. J31P216]MDM0030196.1 transposase [Variovorax sp. J31P216]